MNPFRWIAYKVFGWLYPVSVVPVDGEGVCNIVVSRRFSWLPDIGTITIDLDDPKAATGQIDSAVERAFTS